MDDNKEESLRLAVSKRPECIELRAQLASLLAQSGRCGAALEILHEGTIFALGRDDRLEQLADALLEIDALPEALEALQAASRLCPRDERLHARVEDLSTRLKDSATATRQLFNQYAPKFEQELQLLQYTVPQQIAAMLDTYIERFKGGTIIDLGCGTGLMGGHLRAYADRLIGIDLSAAMLEQARNKQIYDVLVEGDVVEYCRRSAPKATLVTAADVLVYIGDLPPLFAAVAQALVPGGLFAFTVERHMGDGYIINETKRIAHSQFYIEKAAKDAGMSLTICDPITPRYDRGQPVQGLMILLTILPLS